MRDVELKVVEVPVDVLVPYANNAKIHTDKQVGEIAASIEEFGNCDPIGVWTNAEGAPEIVEGHGRVLALKRLGAEVAPVIFLDHLTDEQRRAYAHVHNQTTLSSGFDMDELLADMDELSGFDWGSFGFDYDDGATWFDTRERNDTSRQDGNDEYNEFLDKFEPKKTTDDCYTPDGIYEVVLDYVVKRFGIDRSKVVRPFYPGGDYERAAYPEGCAVVDNPPFSILSQIIAFYLDRGIPFFLFAPTLTCLASRGTVMRCDHIVCHTSITYENGASVNTSFVTNMEKDGTVLESCPELADAINAKDEELQSANKRTVPKYEYPDEVITAAKVNWYSAHHTPYRLNARDCMPIASLDAMEGRGIFGGGLLLSERAAAERAAAERAAATRWQLSEREREIVRSLGDD